MTGAGAHSSPSWTGRLKHVQEVRDIAVLERRFDTRGLVPTVAPPRPAKRRVVRQVRLVGDPGPGRIIESPSAAVFSLRLTANAIGTFVSVLGLSLGLLALAPMAFGFRSVVVASGSMAPALRVSDVVVLGDADDPLPVGAVIDFQVGGERRIHRIVQTIGSEYTTKGDANRSADGGRVAAEDINGVGVMVVPFIGVPSLWLDQGRWLNLAALFVMIAAAVRTTPRRWLFRNDVEGRRFGAGR